MKLHEEFGRGWSVLLACLIGVGLGLSPMPLYTIGVFASSLTAEFGWSRAEVMGGLIFLPIAGIITKPSMGWIVDKYGTRTPALVSMVLLAVAFSLFSQNTGSLTGYYALFALTAFFGAGTLPITFSKIINAWFDKTRGIALGIGFSGTGLCGFFLPSYTNWLIEEFGWRNAYLGVAALPLLISLPVCFFLLRPAPPDSQPSHSQVSLPDYGFSFRDTLKHYRFWLIGISIGLISISVGGLVASMVPILKSTGYTAGQAASMAGVIGLSVLAGRIVTGYLLDLFWAPLVSWILLSLPAISCAILLVNGGSSELYTIIAIAIIGFGTGAEFDIMAFLASRYFGLRAYGRIYGVLYALFGLGAGLGPLAFGATFDAYGSYQYAFIASIFLFIVPSALLLLLGRYPDWEQE